MTLDNMDRFENKNDPTNMIWPNGNMKQDSKNTKAHKQHKIWKPKHKNPWKTLMLTNMTFADYFTQNSLHRMPNAFIIFLLESRLKGLSFEIAHIAASTFFFVEKKLIWKQDKKEKHMNTKNKNNIGKEQET